VLRNRLVGSPLMYAQGSVSFCTFEVTYFVARIDLLRLS
jgi:hypothetical protein